DPGLNSTETISLEVTDAGSGKGIGELVINIIDDVPAITDNGSTPMLTVDETTLGTANTVDFSGAFTVTEGADGATVEYSLVVDSSIATGLTDTLTGETIVLSVNAAGEVEGRTETGDELAFTVSVNAAGEVTLTQLRALEHPDASDPDDALSIAADALQLVATVTDGDGDSEQAQISLGDNLVFLDDGPSIIDDGTVPTLTVDETTLGTANTVDFSGAFTVTEGADGATVEYSLVVDSSIATGLTDTLTGETIVLSVNAAGEVEGRTETGDELAFTVSVNAAGEVTLTQLRALEHPDASDPDDALSIAADALQLVATVTDGDGDSEQAQISLGDNLVFLDDGPSIIDDGTVPTLTVDETTLGTANTVDFSGAFTVTEGADGATVEYSLVVDSSIATGLTDTLTGETIVLSVNAAGEVEGRTETGDELAFTVSVNAAGEVTLTQLRALEHPDASDPDDALSIAADALQLVATVTDGDGDSEQAQISLGDNLVFLDDGPSIIDDGTVPTLTVDETTLGTANTVDFSGAFTVTEGADGATVEYSLVVDSSIATGLTDTLTGETIVLSVNAAGEVEGRTETGDELAFTVSVNAAGEVTLTQLRALEHPDASDPDDALSIAADALQLVATVTDGDGDSEQAQISLGDNLVFLDDGPSIIDDGTVPTLTVDETTLGTANTVDFSGAFTVTEGADGATVEYSLVVDSSIATGLTDTLTGETIVLSVNAAGEVEGRTETGDE